MDEKMEVHRRNLQQVSHMEKKTFENLRDLTKHHSQRCILKLEMTSGNYFNFDFANMILELFVIKKIPQDL